MYKIYKKNKVKISNGAKKNIVTIYLCILLLTFTINAYAANPGEYDDMDKRDPFMPLVTKDGKVTFGYGTIKSIEDIKLEGIVYDPKSGSIAIINGSVLKENDTLGNIKLLKIEQNKVIVLFKQKECAIRLKE